MKKRILVLLAVLTGLSICVSNTNAEEVRRIRPDSVLNRAKDAEEHQKMIDRLKDARPKAVIEGDEPEVGVERPEEAKKKVLIKEIIVEPKSEVLTEEEISAVTNEYINKEVSIAEVRRMIQKINALYREKGFLTARAILPPQKIADGVLKIRLIEGKVGNIIIEGIKHTKARFIRKQISAEEGAILNARRLERSLARFNKVHPSGIIRSELKPGKKPGTTDCVLKVTEPKRVGQSAFVDNAGRDDIGLVRMGTSFEFNDLLAEWDHFSMTGYGARGTMAGSFSYDVPVNRWGTRVRAFYDYNAIEIKKGSLKDLDVDGDSYDFGGYLTQPLYADTVWSVNAFTGFHYKKSVTSFSGADLIQSRTRIFTYGLEAQWYDDHGFWFVRPSLNHGMDVFGGDSDYFTANLDISRLRVLKPDWFLVMRASGQLSNQDLLPSAAQFQIGGNSTVRGYSEGFLIGDDGYCVSAELEFPLMPEKYRLRKMIKGCVFVDHGGAFPYKTQGEEIDKDDFLTSAGFGFVLNFTQYLTGKLNFGIPFTDQEDEEGEVNVHFYLQSKFY